MNASVKVMRSYDYCHFEVSLSGDCESLVEVDQMRKNAARLADKAVEQYKVARNNAEQIEYDKSEIAAIERKPESERSPEEVAILKARSDEAYWKNREYDYQDEWEETQ